MYNSDPMNKEFDIRARTFRFSIQIVILVRSLPKDAGGYTIGDQVIRSGTSIGANIEEAQNASSTKEFIRSMTIALKEARETEYWLKILYEVKLADLGLIEALRLEVNELVKILTAIVKKTKANHFNKVAI